MNTDIHIRNAARVSLPASYSLTLTVCFKEVNRKLIFCKIHMLNTFYECLESVECILKLGIILSVISQLQAHILNS